MQREVLRDLPVLLVPEPSPRPAPLPEPLPWQAPAPQVSAPEETSGRLAPHSFGPPRVAPHQEAHEPAPHQPAPRPPVTHQPVALPPAAHHPTTRPVAHRTAHHPLTEHAEMHADDALLPRPTARRAPRMGGRPVMLFGVAAALVIGTHFALTTTPSTSADPVASAAPADGSGSVEPSPEVAPPRVEQPAEPRARPATGMTRADAPRVTTAPAGVAMMPGPAFAGSVPARPGADSLAAAKAAAALTALEPAAATEEPLPSPVAPPMADHLALPDLPPDSVVGTKRTADTLAMKKILRAINGGQASEGSQAR
jgi:hypothetical protein